MTLKELQTYILELNPYQFDQIAIQVVKYLKLNEQLKNTRPECCPCCGKTGEHLIKKRISAWQTTLYVQGLRKKIHIRYQPNHSPLTSTGGCVDNRD